MANSRPPDEVRLTYPSVAAFQLREAEAVGAGRVYKFLHGRAVPYDEWTDLGDFMESFAAGSFEQSTRARSGRGRALLGFHKRDAPAIGKAETWTHNGGLDGVWKLFDDDESQRLARQAAEGVLGLSVGFQPIRTEAPQKHSGRVWYRHAEAALMETSLTPVPAYEGAQVTLVRSAIDLAAAPAVEHAELDAWRARVEVLRSGQP